MSPLHPNEKRSSSEVAHQEYKGHTDHLESAPGEHGVAVPDRKFTLKEENKLYRKIDLRLMPILALLYLLSFMDRGNIGNARLAGLEADLNMKGFDYNIALSLYFVSYCIFEVPSNLMLSYLSPTIWLSGITVAWGIVMTCMGVVQSKEGLYITRVVLGIAESGLFPGVTLYISIWYPRNRMQTRIALFFGAATVAGAFSGLLAYGIGFMDGIRGYSGWRWIFILEGIITVLAGVLAYFVLVDFPETAKFLSADEAAWVSYRKKTDNSSVGEAHHVSWKYIRQALTSWQVWLSTAYYMSIVVPLYSGALFAPTIINAFGTYTRPQVQLLTVPIYATAVIWVLATAILSDRLMTRFPFVIVDQLMCVVGFAINISPAPNGAKYFGLFLVVSGAYGALPSVVSWLGNNLSGQTKRAVGMAFQIGVGNFGGIASSNIYLSRTAPRYLVGHGVNLGFLAMGLLTAPLYAYLLKRENAKKDAWQAHQDSLPDHEKKVFTAQELRDLGDLAPEFRYVI